MIEETSRDEHKCIYILKAEFINVFVPKKMMKANFLKAADDAGANPPEAATVVTTAASVSQSHHHHHSQQQQQAEAAAMAAAMSQAGQNFLMAAAAAAAASNVPVTTSAASNPNAPINLALQQQIIQRHLLEHQMQQQRNRELLQADHERQISALLQQQVSYPYTFITYY